MLFPSYFNFWAYISSSVFLYCRDDSVPAKCLLGSDVNVSAEIGTHACEGEPGQVLGGAVVVLCLFVDYTACLSSPRACYSYRRKITAREAVSERSCKRKLSGIS